MAKLLLSLALVATQLLSWGAAPVYLCLCGSGSICLDAGPDDCDCCDDATSATTHGASSHDGCGDACDGHEHDGPAAASNSCAALPGTVLSTPCDCRHIELSVARGSAIVRSGASSEAGDVAAQPVPAVAVLRLPTTFGSLAPHSYSESGPPALYALAILGSVVLRC